MWLINRNLNEHYIFLKVFSCTESGPQNAGNHMLQLSSIKIFWGSMLPDPHRKGGLTQGLLVDNVNCYIQTCWLIFFIETPQIE